MPQANKANPNWKGQLYMVGVALGAVLGFLSAYLFAREAEHDAIQEGERPEVSPTALLGLATSTLSLVSKIAQTAKQEKESKNGKEDGKK
jgi:hypothetical protein